MFLGLVSFFGFFLISLFLSICSIFPIWHRFLSLSLSLSISFWKIVCDFSTSSVAKARAYRLVQSGIRGGTGPKNTKVKKELCWKNRQLHFCVFFLSLALFNQPDSTRNVIGLHPPPLFPVSYRLLDFVSIYQTTSFIEITRADIVKAYNVDSLR